MAMSMRITSGSRASACSTASSPLRARPTTSISGSDARIAASASANRLWSSAMRTLIFLLGMTAGSCLLKRNSARFGRGALEHLLDAPGLLADIVALGGGARSGVRAGQRGRRTQRADEPVDVERVDEHARLGRHELRRTADPGGNDHPGTRHG